MKDEWRDAMKNYLSLLILCIVLLISTFTVVWYFTSLSNDMTPVYQEIDNNRNETSIHDEEENDVTETVDHKKKEMIHIPAYDIELDFDPETALLKGVSKIQVWNQAELATDQVNVQVFMNAFNEDRIPPVLPQFLDKAYPKGMKHTKMEFFKVHVNEEETNFDLTQSVLRIHLKKPWEPKQKLNIVLEWEVYIPEIHHRVGSDNNAFWFGNVLPILAVYDNKWYVYDYETIGDPFFSVNSDYDVTFKTPLDYDVFSTGNELETLLKNDMKTTKVEARNVREFTFAITPDHKVLTLESSSGKEVNLFYRKAEEKHVSNTLEMAVDMLDYLEANIGEYPSNQLHIFENNMFITGMEYPGVVYVQAERLMSDTGYVTVLHEIAHQWFYNVVGNNQVLEPWLDEGFATYLTDAFLQGDQLESYYSLELERLHSRNPDLLIQDIYHYNDWSTYWRSNYRKSSLMLFDLRKQMGDQVFYEFVRTYYDTYKFKIATTTAFKELAQAFTDESLDSFFHDWGLAGYE